MSFRCIVAFATAGLALGAPLRAQSTGTVTGRVTSATTGTPLIGAFILLDGGAPRTQTDTAGVYRLGAVPAGRHVVEVRRGTAGATSIADVAAAATVTADFTIHDAPPVLATVTVIGTRTDLDETRERAAEIPGAVSVVGPEEIRATR